MTESIELIRELTRLPIDSPDINKNALIDLYEGIFFKPIGCRKCDSGWQEAYLKLKRYLKNIEMAKKNKSQYKFIPECIGCKITIAGVGEYTDSQINDQVYAKYIKGTKLERMFQQELPLEKPTDSIEE